MGLNNYCKDKDKLKEGNEDKTVISDDAFAIVEAIQDLTRSLRNG